MIFVKIAMVGVAIVVMMVVARDQRWPQRSGVIGVCASTTPLRSAPDAIWYACTEGVLTGFPNLEADSCTSDGIYSHHEVWHCDKLLGSLPGA